jgi:hypothetical protein
MQEPATRDRRFPRMAIGMDQDNSLEFVSTGGYSLGMLVFLIQIKSNPPFDRDAASTLGWIS